MPPDFGRDVHCVLGLPFDAVTEAQAEAALRLSARERKRCFLSTPNLNFAVQCVTDAAFRNSVLHSDLNVADGWPIVMVARWLDAPLPERVAGSTLFERLHKLIGEPISVYFFGGPDGAAETACNRVNAIGAGLLCVGHDSPGFGSIEALSAPERIDAINESGADFLVVALGAKKGQAWIQHNLGQIKAPIVSHLGAVVNFAAGTVRRAPPLAQRLRLEWLWRILEEPALWRRYADDGLAFARLLITRVIPLAWQLRTQAPSRYELTRATMAIERRGADSLIRISGAWTHSNLSPLRQHFQALAEEERSVTFDLSALTYADGAVMALLALLYGWQEQRGLGWQIAAASPSLRRMARLACSEYLLQAVEARRPLKDAQSLQ